MSDAPTIRAMTASDIDAVHQIEQIVFSDPWPRSAFKEMLQMSNRINLVMIASDGAALGYVLGQVVADELQIQNIAVAPPYLRQGFGSQLLRRAEEEGVARGALCCVLDVRTNNEAALGLYNRFGYRMIGRRKDYYRRPVCDALVLFRRLDRMPNDESGQEHRNGVVS